MEQLGKEYIKAVYCHPAYLTSKLNKHHTTARLDKSQLESRLLGEVSTTSDMQMIPPLWQKSGEELKSFLMKVKEESEKAG